MKIKYVEIQNFRKLESCHIDFSEKETVFVGANNSGKTSAMDALMLFLNKKSKIETTDFTLSNWIEINKIGTEWIETAHGKTPNFSIEKWQSYLPSLDVWINANDDEVHYVSHLIPTLDWQGGLLGIRLRFEPKKEIEELYKAFISLYKSGKETIVKAKNHKSNALKLWPKDLRDFLDRRLHSHFKVSAYILDPTKSKEPRNGTANIQEIPIDSTPLDKDPFKGLMKIDIINAQRGFSDPNASDSDDVPKITGNLSVQFREYYSKHLNPSDLPDSSDIEALQAIVDAQSIFDRKLEVSFKPALGELEKLGYPGFSNPKISLSSKVNPIDTLNHSAAVQFDVIKNENTETYPSLRLPEKYNGLGYQNLISMTFKLIRFRDEWMRVGKVGKKNIEPQENYAIEPLHIVLVEEPEAHLHAQVQQVFINKAYDVLRNHNNLKARQHFSTQLIVSTHSSHIAHEIDFTSLRYFRRDAAAGNNKVPTANVVNLSKIFENDRDKTTKFAIRYLKTTHCDLFFADAVILVEGPAERMLIPDFIRHKFSELTTCYISILEIGGSHAHRLRPLMENLGLISLIITDIDSVENRTAVQPKRNRQYKTNNDTLKTWLPKKESLDELLDLPENKKQSDDSLIRVAYQRPVEIKLSKESAEIIPYTFEDALVFENISLFKELDGIGLIKKFKNAINNKTTVDELGKAFFDDLRNGKKAEFALELLYLDESKELTIPTYIKEGLEWLRDKLELNQKNIL